MYLENKSNLEIEMSQTAGAQGQQSRAGGHRKSEVLAGNFDELRLLEGFSDRRERQKMLHATTMPPGHCATYANTHNDER